jgi:hypothetical protein
MAAGADDLSQTVESVSRNRLAIGALGFDAAA